MTLNQILLNIDGHFLPIGNVSADANGIFVTVEEIVTAARDSRWACRWCGRINSMEEGIAWKNLSDLC